VINFANIGYRSL